MDSFDSDPPLQNCLCETSQTTLFGQLVTRWASNFQAINLILNLLSSLIFDRHFGAPNKVDSKCFERGVRIWFGKLFDFSRKFSNWSRSQLHCFFDVWITLHRYNVGYIIKFNNLELRSSNFFRLLKTLERPHSMLEINFVIPKLECKLFPHCLEPKSCSNRFQGTARWVVSLTPSPAALLWNTHSLEDNFSKHFNCT